MRTLSVAAWLLVLTACSDGGGGSGGGGGADEPPPEGRCYENPLGCEGGTTCAFDDEDGQEMSCLPAGAAGKGDTCRNVAGAPECGEKLVCLQLTGQANGSCTPYCSGDAPCGSGQVCAKVQTEGGHTFYACVDE